MTPDARFSPLHEDGNDVWALKIRDTRMHDSGQYECQVSHESCKERFNLILVNDDTPQIL